MSPTVVFLAACLQHWTWALLSADECDSDPVQPMEEAERREASFRGTRKLGAQQSCPRALAAGRRVREMLHQQSHVAWYGASVAQAYEQAALCPRILERDLAQIERSGKFLHRL